MPMARHRDAGDHRYGLAAADFAEHEGVVRMAREALNE